VTAASGASELTFTEPDVDAVHRAWVKKGLRVVAPPADLEFGRTFLAVDPDGHRLRVLRPTAV
jgi:predicted enzyme related to lactoylglutathione lyase